MFDDAAMDHELQHELDGITKNLSLLTHASAFAAVPSTNDVAIHYEKQGAPTGSLIMTSLQTQGRGRHARTWLMKRGDIALSIILRQPHLPRNMAHLPMALGLAIVESLARVGVNAQLKWPNDIVYSEPDFAPLDYFGRFRKLGGILVENVFRGGHVASIIGIGINVAADPSRTQNVPHAYALGDIVSVDRSQYLRALLPTLDHYLSSREDSDLLARYQTQCATLGAYVRAEVDGRTICGQAVAINTDGSLVIHDGKNDHYIFAGDVNSIA